MINNKNKKKNIMKSSCKKPKRTNNTQTKMEFDKWLKEQKLKQQVSAK